MRNFNEQQSLKPSILKAAVFVLLVMVCPMEQAQSQSPPSGPAGGVLSGTYPNPGLAVDRVRKTGDAMTGALNITLPNPGALVTPFSLSTSGNAGPDRGIAFLFNLPANPNAVLGARIVAAREGWGLPSYLSFSTHNGTAVTEALRITSSGKVGVGTTAPRGLLDVAGDGKVLTVGVNSSYGAGLVLSGSAGSAVLSNNAFMSAGAANFNNVDTSKASALIEFANQDTYFRRIGSGGAGASVSESMFIQGSTGNVGIGTTAPGSKLFVGSGTPAVATLTGVNVALGGNSYVSASNGTVNTFIGADSSSYGIVGTISNHALGLRANNALAVTVLPNGNVGIGTPNPAYKLDIVGSVQVSGNIAAKYQDVAEWVESSQSLPAGTIVVLDHTKSNQVVASTQAYDTRVAGVISTQPGITLGESGEAKVLVATTGRVKIKVDATSAPIQVGDLLVTGDREGFAMKSLPVNIGGVQLHRPGTLVGKALEPLAKGTGEILVLLSLH